MSAHARKDSGFLGDCCSEVLSRTIRARELKLGILVDPKWPNGYCACAKFSRPAPYPYPWAGGQTVFGCLRFDLDLWRLVSQQPYELEG